MAYAESAMTRATWIKRPPALAVRIPCTYVSHIADMHGYADGCLTYPARPSCRTFGHIMANIESYYLPPPRNGLPSTRGS